MINQYYDQNIPYMYNVPEQFLLLVSNEYPVIQEHQ